MEVHNLMPRFFIERTPLKYFKFALFHRHDMVKNKIFLLSYNTFEPLTLYKTKNNVNWVVDNNSVIVFLYNSKNEFLKGTNKVFFSFALGNGHIYINSLSKPLQIQNRDNHTISRRKVILYRSNCLRRRPFW